MPCFNLAPTFFGFKPEHQVQLHDQLFELVWAGEGRWDWDTIYNLPIMYREFIYHKIREHYDKQKTNSEKQQKMMQSKTATTVKPPINPTYTAKAPRK